MTAPAEASRIRRMLGGSHRPPRRHVDWVGTSMGGLMGMMLAAKHHSPIRRLVLNDVGPLVPWPALLRMKQAHSGAHVTFATVEDAEGYLREACKEFGPLSGAHGAMWPSTAHCARAALRPGLRPRHHYTYAQWRRSGRRIRSEFLYGVDLWPTYDAIRCPTLVLRGRGVQPALEVDGCRDDAARAEGGDRGIRRHRPRTLAHGGGPDQGGAGFFAR